MRPRDVNVLNVGLSVPLSAVAPGMGVAVYAGLVGALLLCAILVLCVGVLAYRRRCRHLHGDITDSSSALTAAFHPGNYKPPRQGEFTHTYIHTFSHKQLCTQFHLLCSFSQLFFYLSISIEVLFNNLFLHHTVIYNSPQIKPLHTLSPLT